VITQCYLLPDASEHTPASHQPERLLLVGEGSPVLVIKVGVAANLTKFDVGGVQRLRGFNMGKLV